MPKVSFSDLEKMSKLPSPEIAKTLELPISEAVKMLNINPKTFKQWLIEGDIEPKSAPYDKRIKLISFDKIQELAYKHNRTINGASFEQHHPAVIESDRALTSYREGITSHNLLPVILQDDSLREILLDLVIEPMNELEKSITLLKAKNEELESAINELQNTRVLELRSDTVIDADSISLEQLPQNGEIIAGVKIRIYEKLVAKETAAQLAEMHGANPKASWGWPLGSRSSIRKLLEYVWDSLHNPHSRYKRFYPDSSWHECEDYSRCDCHEIANEHLQGVTHEELQRFMDRYGRIGPQQRMIFK